MTVITIKVTGLAELHYELETLQKKLNSSLMVEGIAMVVADQAKINARSGHGVHAGGYPNTITGLMGAAINSRATGVDSAIVGCGAYYAPFVEFGHKQTPGRFVPIYNAVKIRRGEYKGRYEVTSGLGFRLKRDFAPAYPFMRPAIKQSIAKITRFIVNYLRPSRGKQQ